jgi:glutamine synthetase
LFYQKLTQGENETNQEILKKSIVQKIQNEDIRTIRINLMDLSGISRTRNIPAETFIHDVMENGVSYPSAMFHMDSSTKLVETEGGKDSGFPSWDLIPDLTTFTSLPWAPHVAKVIADVIDENGKEVPYSPRSILKKVISRYEQEGLYVKGAFEFEFYVFEKVKGRLVPILPSSNSYSEMDQVKVSHVLDEVIQGLQKMGSNPEMGNTEYGTGQFEITYRPFTGIGIADMAHYYKSAIKEILHKQELTATFMSQPLSNSSSSGGHVHLSLYHQDKTNAFYDANDEFGITDTCRDFIGGQLHHAFALNSLCNSTINSYKRLLNHFFAPQNVSWGYDNRTTMIRIPRSRGENTRIENRLPGADTNPYISLTAMLAAGFDGIKKKMRPEGWVKGNAYFNDLPLLQTDMPSAIRSLEESAMFREVFGIEFISQYKTLRLSEYERYQKQITDWEFHEYVNLF